ncbi:MAG TPA: hypothetical protein VGX28_00550 [Frankiaceae bacterium]|jgi:hypothetical protein|nr:hypothetical protein [Frankiaceae bacterium]
MRGTAPVWVVAGFALAVGSPSAVTVTNAATSSGERAIYESVSPARILDTRAAGQGPALASGTPRTVAITGRAGVPADAVAVVVSATVRKPTVTGYLTVWPTGTARPDVSNVNFVAGTTITNLVTAALGDGGAVSLYVPTGPVDVLVDVVGYYVGHDHDDRYFTKAATQARTAANALTCPSGSYLQAVAADGTPTCRQAAPVPAFDSMFLGEGTVSSTVPANAVSGQSGDAYRVDLTLGDGARYVMNGNRLVVSGTLTLGEGATISNDGGDGTLSAAGTGAPGSALGGGGDGACAVPPTQVTNALGGAGSNMGSTGTVAVRPPVTVGGPGLASWAPAMLAGRSFDGARIMGGNGGGGTACGAGATNGGGGGGGGVIVVIAKRIVLTGSAAYVTADGGDSANAGGGGGGVVIVASTEPRPAGLVLRAAGGTSGGDPLWKGFDGLTRFYGIP